MKKTIITFALTMTIVVAVDARQLTNDLNNLCIAEPFKNITPPQDWILYGGINEYAYAMARQQIANEANRQRQAVYNKYNNRGRHKVTKKTKRHRTARRANRHRRTRR